MLNTNAEFDINCPYFIIFKVLRLRHFHNISLQKRNEYNFMDNYESFFNFKIKVFDFDKLVYNICKEECIYEYRSKVFKGKFKYS